MSSQHQDDPIASPPAKARFVAENVAIAWLLFGGLLPLYIGWFVGVVLVWKSAAWTWAEKLLATLVLPGGLAWAFRLLPAQLSVPGGAMPYGFPLFVVVPVLLLPLASAAFLVYRRRPVRWQ